MLEVDWKSKVGCLLPSRVKGVLVTSRRLEVDLGSVWYQVRSDWHTKVTPMSRRLHKLNETVDLLTTLLN